MMMFIKYYCITMAKSLTLVTAFFDLGKREPQIQRRQADEYLKLGDFLFSLDIKLVFFCDPEFVSIIEEKRKLYKLMDKTVVISHKLEDCFYYTILDKITANRQKNPIINANPNKDTPLYLIINWSKFDLINETIKRNPFSSTHFAWLDFGIAHVANLDYISDGIFQTPSDQIKLLMMRDPDPKLLSDKKVYYSFIRGYVSSGYICGSKSSHLQLYQLFSKEVGRCLELEVAPSEEQILPIIIREDPDLFEFYYGDYKFILGNYIQCRGDVQRILINLGQSRLLNDFIRTCEIGGKLLDSYLKGHVSLTSLEYHNLLDEYYIAAYYINKCLAKDLAIRYAKEVQINRQLCKIYLSRKQHIDSNFGFVDINIRLPKRFIYDCFLFFNELDMLNLRLHELDDVVDYFIIVESERTFSNMLKPLYFQKNKEKYSKFLHKIIHLIIPDFYNLNNTWDRELFSRNYALKYIRENCLDNDIVLNCDLDEIPNPQIIRSIELVKDLSTPLSLEMDMYYYNLNWCKKNKWNLANVCMVKHLNSMTLQDARNKVNIFPKILNAGWHLSYLLPVEDIKKKIQAFSHQEFNNDKYLNSENIKDAISQGKDLFFRGPTEDLIERGMRPLPQYYKVLPEQFHPK